MGIVPFVAFISFFTFDKWKQSAFLCSQETNAVSRLFVKTFQIYLNCKAFSWQVWKESILGSKDQCITIATQIAIMMSASRSCKQTRIRTEIQLWVTVCTNHEPRSGEKNCFLFSHNNRFNCLTDGWADCPAPRLQCSQHNSSLFFLPFPCIKMKGEGILSCRGKLMLDTKSCWCQCMQALHIHKITGSPSVDKHGKTTNTSKVNKRLKRKREMTNNKINLRNKDGNATKMQSQATWHWPHTSWIYLRLQWAFSVSPDKDNYIVRFIDSCLTWMENE